MSITEKASLHTLGTGGGRKTKQAAGGRRVYRKFMENSVGLSIAFLHSICPATSEKLMNGALLAS